MYRLRQLAYEEGSWQCANLFTTKRKQLQDAQSRSRQKLKKAQQELLEAQNQAGRRRISRTIADITEELETREVKLTSLTSSRKDTVTRSFPIDIFRCDVFKKVGRELLELADTKIDINYEHVGPKVSVMRAVSALDGQSYFCHRRWFVLERERER